MAVPDFQSLTRPCLVVHQDRQLHTPTDLRDRLAAQIHVSDEDRALMLPSGRQPLFSNCVAWAVTHLAQVGLLDRPARGVTQIRVRSSEVLDRYKDHVDMKVLRHFPDGPELAVLMIKHHCGVIVEESFVLKQVDENLFEEA